MSYPSIFDHFERVESRSDGVSVYDFLGGAVHSSYKLNWRKNVVPSGQRVKPNYPGLSEWTIDWVSALLAAMTAGDEFRTVELGAGYGQWLVASVLAYRAKKDGVVRGVAVEAEPTHYKWLRANIKDNLGEKEGVQIDTLNAAAGLDGTAMFPRLDNPEEDYGASYVWDGSEDELVEVECMSLPHIYERFSGKPVDFLHVDIQGGERDLFSHSQVTKALQNTRVVLVGTHRSNSLHETVKEKLMESGLNVLVEWPRKSTVRTVHGRLDTFDGALLAVDNETVNMVDGIFDVSELQDLCAR